MSGKGRNTVHGFRTGFEYDSDVIQVDDFNNLKFSFDNTGLLHSSNDTRLKFDGIGLTMASGGESFLR